jgi:hypothetical protein
MTDPEGYLDGNWKRIMNDLLIERGTKIYAINDNGLAGDALQEYKNEPGYNLPLSYKYDLQDNRFCDDPAYNREFDPNCVGKDQWSSDHLTPGWATHGTNNDPDFRDIVITWLTN